MRYVFSDPHFDSENIRKNANRPFASVEQMNAALISNYNQIVQKSDVCYWLGDIMYDAKKEKVRKILSRMNGHKYLILGNHDRNHSVWWWADCGFEKVFKHPVYDAENYIMLSHEPLEEFGNLPNIANIHGHIHISDYDFPIHDHCVNVCVEKTNYKPVLLENPFLEIGVRRFSR